MAHEIIFQIVKYSCYCFGVQCNQTLLTIDLMKCVPLNKCWSHIAPFSRPYLVKVVVQLNKC